MSEEIKPQENESEVVAKDAYVKVSQDMHKFKSQAKQLEAKLAEIQAEQEARERATLEEKEQWHTLYKKAEEKLKAIENERLSERSKFIESHKVNAVIQNLGGFKKPEYNKFIDSSKIEVTEDGSIDEKSVVSEVERIKREYPELIKAAGIKPLPDSAPKQVAPKSLDQMSPAERAALRRRLISGT